MGQPASSTGQPAPLDPILSSRLGLDLQSYPPASTIFYFCNKQFTGKRAGIGHGLLQRQSYRN